MPAPLVTISDYEAQAREKLDPGTWAYFGGGAADELTLNANVQAWQGMDIWPRILRPLAGG